MLRLVVPPAPRLIAAATLVLLGTIHAPALAQKMRPGLWETTVNMGGEMGAQMARMQQQMANLPPAQRAQIEAMMASQGVGVGVGKPNTVRSCITPEMAARDQFNPGDRNCRSMSHTRSGNTVRFRFACDGERGGTAEGEGEFTIVSDAETRGKMFVNATRQGQTMRMDMQSTSKWLGADCGTVKPVAATK